MELLEVSTELLDVLLPVSFTLLLQTLIARRTHSSLLVRANEGRNHSSLHIAGVYAEGPQVFSSRRQMRKQKVAGLVLTPHP